MPIGDQYLNSIVGFEGFTPKATWDYKQWTNGYGTRARFPGEVISEAEAKRRYQDEISSAERQVDGLGVPLDPGKKAALTSLTYNAGPKWMESGLGQAVKAGDWNTAKQRFLQYTKADGQTLPGLVKRRMAEASWLGGEPPQAPTSAAQNGAPMPTNTGVPVPASYSPDEMAMQRKLGMMLMQEGTSTAPVQSWTQALARVLQGAQGGYMMREADKQDRMMRGEGDALIGQYLGSLTGGPSSVGVPSQQPQAAAPDASRALGQALLGGTDPMTQDQQNVGRFAQPNLAMSMPKPQQPAPVAAAPAPVQVADASGEISPQMLKQMLANSTSRPYAEAYIKKRMLAGSQDKPANVQEWEYFQRLSPEDKQKFIEMKRGEKYLDAGTQFVNPRTRDVISKDLAGAEKAKEVGTAQGKQAASAQGDISAAEQALTVLEKIKTNSYLDRGTGMSSIGNFIPGTGGYDFDALVEQAKSGAFLTAIQQLRGLGALSNAEGATATAAVTRMKTGLSKEAFLEAVNDYEAVIRKGMAQAQGRLPGATPQQSGDGWQDLGNGVKIREKR